MTAPTDTYNTLGGFVDVILRDGTTLRLRPPTSVDVDAVVAFFSELSDRSAYQRFHGIRRIDGNAAAHFVDVDPEEGGALIGTFADQGDEQVVALASFARLRDPAASEVAFAVADRLQGRGIRRSSPTPAST